MIALAVYMVKVVLLSGIFFGYYYVALRNGRFHGWNRFFLVSAMLLSLLIPLISWPGMFSGYRTEGPLYFVKLREFTLTVRGRSVDAGAGAGVQWLSWIYAAYGLIVLGLFYKLAGGLRKIYARIVQGHKTQFSFFTLVTGGTGNTPFSFFRFVFWFDGIPLNSPEGKQILGHELVHVTRWHSLDKLGMELVLIFFWMNPFFYLIRKELHIIHEFLADRASCQEQDRQGYATLLLSQVACGVPALATNPFFQKELTRRIRMIIRVEKERKTWLKRVLAIPLVLLVSIFFIMEQGAVRQARATRLENSFAARSRVILPFGKQLFPVTAAAAADPVSPVTRRSAAGTRAAGRAALVEYRPVRPSPPPPPPPPAPRIRPSTGQEALVTQNLAADEDKVFTFVEMMPSFPGGQTALMQYLSSHIRYPAIARENGDQGTVVIQFDVEMDGTLSHIVAVDRRHVSKGTKALETEATRVVKEMPSWHPGIQNGIKVAVRYSLPIRFVLQ